MKQLLASITICLLLALAGTLSAAESGADAMFRERIRPVLQKYCFECHSGEKVKGDLHLDSLSPDFNSADNARTWHELAEKLTAGEMPPKKKTRPTTQESRDVVDWVDGALVAADAARQREEGRAMVRRLNRVEYENTVRDLLAISTDLKDLLPADESLNGFDNAGQALTLSPVLMERFLEAADTALNSAIVHGRRPETTKLRFSLKEDRYVSQRIGGNALALDDSVVLFTSFPTQLSKTRREFRGTYHVRISAHAFRTDGKPLIMQVTTPPANGLGGYYAIAPDQPTIVEWTGLLTPRDLIQITPYGLGNSYIRSASAYKGPGLAIDWVEIEGPLLETWPPESHRRVFGDCDPKTAGLPGARQILHDFVSRAFRRPVPDSKIELYVNLVKSRLEQRYSFEEALLFGIKAVLCSPDFLFMKESPGKLDDFALANRLSYFLWQSMPDAKLLESAQRGTLRDPAELHAQVERMLNDPKAARLTENFLGQWLDLRQIDATTPDKNLYPEFDHFLQYSMLRETQLFFEEVLKNDLSSLSFVDSDFAMLNEPLAKHYGIAGISGPEFRKVGLPPHSHRGGVLTQGAVLKVTANGTVTSPVLRGVWVLKNIIGQPVPPPPPDVPAIEPDIRGATTIRDQLARHRKIDACASCHRKIDPAGFALENFDVIGGWRENYRILDSAVKPVNDHGRIVIPFKQGPPVDAGDVLTDGRKFRDIDDFKALLLSDPDRIARTVAEKLVVFATGTGIRPADRAAIDAIVSRSRLHHYGLRTLVHEIVQSDLFGSK